MRLMTKELEKRFAQVGSQKKVKDPVIVAKFFLPIGEGTWYATEYDPKTQTFFGYVSVFGDWSDEWGYFSLLELEAIEGPFGRRVQRDLFWTEKSASKVPDIR